MYSSVTDPFQGKTRKSASDCPAQVLGQIEAYLIQYVKSYPSYEQLKMTYYRAALPVFTSLSKQKQGNAYA